MHTEESFGEYLRIVIKATGNTIVSIAADTGISRKSIHLYLADRRFPSRQNLCKLCHCLGLSYERTEAMVSRRPAWRPRKPVCKDCRP